MAKPSAVGAVLLLVLMAPARSEEPPDPGKIQFRFGFPAGVYIYRQAVSGETWQQMDGRDLMRDRTELAVTFTLTIWNTENAVLLRFLPRRIEAAANRMGFSGRYDSDGEAAAQSRPLKDHLAPLLEASGVLRIEEKIGGTGIADRFNPASGGVASMPLALFFTGDSVAHFLREMHWVLPEKPRGEGETWKSRTAAWAIRSARDRKMPEKVTFARIERDANGACAVFSFASDLPPTAAAGGGAATLAKAEGSHTGMLRYDLATRLVREYRDETKWVNHFSMAGPAGTVRQVLANAYTSHVQIVPVSDDPGPLPPDLAPDAGDGGDEEHADEE